MKSRMLLSPLWKIGSWKKLFVCGKKSLEKPKVELNATLELPHEIYEIIEWEILPRLPAKSLGRFMCVCKQWKSLISACDQFAWKNLQQSLTHCKVLEIGILSQKFSTRDCADLNNHNSTTTRSIPFLNKAQHVFLLASLGGLVFVNTGDPNEIENTREYAFWNPLTGAYKKLSVSPNFFSCLSAFGFYFDSDKKDYKVVQVTCSGAAFKAFIYSQRLNSRKEIQWFEKPQLLYDLFWLTPVSLGESLYFMGLPRHWDHPNQFWIVVFDVKSEKFREVKSPQFNQENAYCYGSLMVSKGCIYICVTSRRTIMKADGELWRMDGDGDGWTKVKDFSRERNHPLMLDEIIDMEELARNLQASYNYCKCHIPSTVLYLETLVSPYPKSMELV